MFAVYNKQLHSIAVGGTAEIFSIIRKVLG